ncbi:MAG TPA: enoyl-CoA hydratase-related protein [Planctomycetota bacterium]|jgi:enoyl-CoA hydratase|nr:enoyl-CoA hydratase-related protein [Planctomycetota bacterium]
MGFENLLFEVSEGLARVTVNRPEKLNVLNDATVRELRGAFERVRDDPSIGGAIVTGAGEKAFSAGADIAELARMGPLEGRQKSRIGQEALTFVETCGKPSIAAIQGFCFGGGLELALACTLRTASTTAKLGLPEVTLGILPGYGGTQRLARVAGPAVAREWILTGEAFPAAEAHRVGVVHRVYEPASLLPETERLLRTILSRGPVAVRCALEAIARGLDGSLEEGQRLEADLFAIVATTADMKEGMAAFLEKRKPRFTGR